MLPLTTHLPQISRNFITVLPRGDPTFGSVAIQSPIVWPPNWATRSHRSWVGGGVKRLTTSCGVAAKLVRFFLQELIESFHQHEDSIVHECSLCLWNIKQKSCHYYRYPPCYLPPIAPAHPPLHNTSANSWGRELYVLQRRKNGCKLYMYKNGFKMKYFPLQLIHNAPNKTIQNATNKILLQQNKM